MCINFRLKSLLLLLAFTYAGQLSAQQYALYNTKTLFDAFENPERKVYTQDTSRKFSFNFFFPNMGTNAIAAGNAEPILRRMIGEGVFSGTGVTIGKKNFNNLIINNNTYLAMLRVYHDVLRHSEFGFAWQLRSDTYVRASDETIAILDNYRLFTDPNYTDPFNNFAVSQNYHQFSFSYRENYDKRLGVGFKLSYLSGIVYQKINVRQSSLFVNPQLRTYNLKMDGVYRSSFAFDGADSIVSASAVPGFTNPGAAVTVGATYKLRYNWNISGHLKDIGFIRWNNNSPKYSLKQTITVENAQSKNASSRLGNKLDSAINESYKTESFIGLLNGKAEMLLTKTYEHYEPSLLLSKNTFFRGGDIGLIQQIKYGSWNLGVSTVYNTSKAFMAGGSLLYKTPGFEVFLGCDQVFKTYSMIRGAINGDKEFGSGHVGASVYWGMAFNFGRVVEHPMNTNRIPGTY
ncbi:DUF5723 family protein [Hufsiella ginkgonis]|uniref:DUF5723 domain-containing protein n=1 Tax=Hufsiella ginkgonis TaxID=2695274 RepID=A0A7K1XY71_9SPHI|nr:DUF5723 family protein [Hufsiella ginkgonis]MXV15930.1 hypothetical protein [Hufsiella ginkgonis]